MAKREGSSGDESAPEVDMTPMIDIVFQLIAFFMVITNFEQTQADERVKLPRDALAKPPEVKIEHELVLNVGFERNMKGEKLDQEPWLFNFVNGDPVRPLLASKQLKQEAKLFQNKQIDPKDVTVKVRADAEVQTGIVQELIKICQDAGYEKFAMSAMSGPEERADRHWKKQRTGHTGPPDRRHREKTQSVKCHSRAGGNPAAACHTCHQENRSASGGWNHEKTSAVKAGKAGNEHVGHDRHRVSVAHLLHADAEDR